MHMAFPLSVMEFLLPEEVPTASEECSHYQKKRDATAKKIALLLKSSSNCQSKSYDNYAKSYSKEHQVVSELEFGDSYEAPKDVVTTASASDGTGKKKGRTVTLTTDDMQKRKNDVKARNTLLLALPNEHQLRFSKHKTAQELCAAILKTFSGNEATKKTKKNLLNHLEFMDIEIDQDDLNQKFLTSLAPEWLMHTIVWRNRSDLDTISLDDLYNHLKVYVSEVQKKSESNSQNIAFISSAKHSSGNGEVNTASISTASTNVSTTSANIGAASISQDTACAYIASQSNGKKITIQGTDVAGFDKLKVECFNCHKMGYFARECRAPRSQDRGRRDNYRQGSKVEEQTLKALMAIDGVGWDWSYMANDEENHALVTDEEAPTEFTLMAKTSAKSETGLSEFADDTVTDYSRPSPAIESTSDNAQNRNPSVIETEASPSTISPKPFIKFVKATNRLTETKTAKVETTKPVVKYAAMYIIPSKSSNVRGNQRNWNNLKSHQLGVKKGRTCPTNSHKAISPRTVIHKPYRPPMRPMRPNINAAQPNRTSFYKPAHSYTKRPFQRTSAVRSQYRGPRVSPVSRNLSNVNRKFPTANIKFPTGSTKVSTADMVKKANVVKASACYISYLSDYEPFDGGYVSFGQGGCKINGKGTIKTGKLQFENVYFVKDLKDFKLIDDTNVLLRTLRQHNMYSIDLNNIVPHKDLTCFVAKASTDECMLRHKRLVVTDDFSRFTLTFFLKTKDETGGILRKFITEIENLKDLKSLVNKSYNKTPYELFNSRTPAIGFLKPFGCHVMILNTLDHLGKFEAKRDKGYFIGYSMSSKAFRVFNKRTKRVEENLHVDFLENKAIEKGTKDAVSQEVKKDVSSLRYIALPNWIHEVHLESSSSQPQDTCNFDKPESSGNFNPTATLTNPTDDQLETLTVETPIPTVSSPVLTTCLNDSTDPSSDTRLILERVANQVETLSLDNILTLTNQFEDILGVTTNSDESNRVEADVSNMETTITASPTPTLRIHKEHPKSQIIGPMDTPIQTRTKKIADALQDPSWVEAMQEELLQFKIHNVWTLINCPKGVRPIGTKWVLKNKKDERGIVIKNKARLVAQGHTQEERIDYDEVFAPVARIKAIRLFLAYASFVGFIVYQTDVKSAFLYGTIDEEVLLEPGMLCKEFEALMYEKFQMSAMGELNFFLGLQVLQKKNGIFLSQDKYVGDILKKFGYSDVRSANTPTDKENP
nr:putative ribonuclease H-like domain-containing protein [Tanacetum cinerariifolium]